MSERKVDLTQAAQQVLELEGRILIEAAKRLGPELEEAVKLILKATKVVVLGIGKSGLVGQKIAATLCSTGT
ncbi:MAG TPA: hypothetical protein PLV25_00710, partial [Opitutales bacterium]|nr:hypothetical protein [Opitutales bacterium]